MHPWVAKLGVMQALKRAFASNAIYKDYDVGKQVATAGTFEQLHSCESKDNQRIRVPKSIAIDIFSCEFYFDPHEWSWVYE